MAIVVARIDDRLVHGQVVIGWCRPHEITRILLVDDQVAETEFEQDLYRLAVPDGIAVEFLTERAAPARLDQIAADAERVLVLTGSVLGMIGLQHARPSLLQTINIGGVHDRPGRRERLRYVYLTDEELGQLSAIARAGVSVTAQDLPTSRPVLVEQLAT